MLNEEQILNPRLDGITVHHAGELLFDVTLTTVHRKNYWDTYVRCLEDFAFSLVYGNKFSVSGSLIGIGTANPGRILIKQYEEWYTDFDAHITETPEDMIILPQFRDNVIYMLENLSDAYGSNHSYWDHFIKREAETYLLKEVTSYEDLEQRQLLHKTISDPSEYVYAKSPPYYVDKELQERIPYEGYLAPLTNELAPLYKDNDVCRSAITEFISRATLAHVVNYWWYDFAYQDEKRYYSFRVPHVTRTILHLSGRREKDKLLRDYILAAVMRHALSEALDNSLNRSEVPDRLAALSQMKIYERIRNEIINLFEIESSKISKEDKIKKYNRVIDFISRTSNQNDGVLDCAELGFDLEGPKVAFKGSVIEAIANKFRPSRKALIGIAKRGRVNDYMISLNRVFPELEIGS